MTEHGALYRKYRPQTFADVRDQDHIVKVLEGAIEKGEIPHALLFSGTRGTGKTTLARIFAKAIGTKSVDLYEIDAASNRGIDDVRELKEAVHTVPYESKYKIYIIDEVHMLTKEAFNALLKTLEEPPAHVVFILATTEEEKLLDTILSRCLVFRFRSPSRAVLADTVTDVAKKEGFTLSTEAAALIAIAADGSFRDALGVTQKVIMASGDEIGDVDEVAEIIGAPKREIITDLLRSLHDKNVELGLEAVAKATACHTDVKLLLKLLLEHVRAVMLLRNRPQDQSVLESYNTDTQTLLNGFAKEATNSLNSHLLLKLITAAEQSTRSPLPYLPLEIVVVEHCEKV
ncbi:MAG: DNA polymerase III subunit gamma/tau [Candidatus Nomurabacteria bacterium]|nr:DNA polymerase III subunit gamma/tau [Candidatus Nomurabacteria bacterium]USN87725.1 MAG: DNA polymerase III subunit gamma/tau [Candidatus Nomurabacteria bacterium]